MLSVVVVFFAVSASAEHINWTTWSTNTFGNINNSGITVTYAGELGGLSGPDYPSWLPATTYSGGTVDNPPVSSGQMVQLSGGNMNVNSITFSAPVQDPVMAIWSLGQAFEEARFAFDGSEPFTIESGGPSQEFGGSSIALCGDDAFAVCGLESNGTIQFHGTFTKISWTNPEYEFYYGFTVGVPGEVPEPSTILLLAPGLLAGFGVIRRSLSL